MKKLFFLLSALFFTNLFAQNIFTAKVLDGSTLEPLSNVSVTVENSQLTAISDFEGVVVLKSLKEGARIKFSHIGFDDYVHTFSAGTNPELGSLEVEIIMNKKSYQAPEYTVSSVRANSTIPIAQTNMTKADIEKQNLGQDIPFLLNQTPSVVVNSDAGTGIGYTGIRIRGTDITRINVTFNGLPVNDPESQGSYFVDFPDLASSINSIQIQRGVGTSTNGSGSFGGSINISTNDLNPKPYAKVSSSVGFFKTFKNTVEVNTGLIGKHFAFYGRLSKLTSDGYVDRGWSDLKSFFVSGGYYGKSTVIKLNIFSGKEATYQAWNGVDQSIMDTNRTYNVSGTDYFQKAIPYNNQTDNYQQDYYQLFVNQQAGKYFNFNAALFYTRGRGYYEEYKVGQTLSSYGIAPAVIGTDTAFTSDLVRQLWLDNHYYGFNAGGRFTKKKWDVTLSGGFYRYEGSHYGKVTWAQFAGNSDPDRKYYDVPAVKMDGNIFVKAEYEIISGLKAFADVQYRAVDYTITGFESDASIQVHDVFHFVNPKVGVSYEVSAAHRVYGYFGMAGHEPNRVDYQTSINQKPKAETLRDFELGYVFRHPVITASINGFFMDYTNQLVNTGKLNSVGAYTRTNAASSYRAGFEIEAGFQILKNLTLNLNFTYSRNRIQNFVEYVDNYDTGVQDSVVYKETDISYSPDAIGGFTITYSPVKNLFFDLYGKFVSQQFLDNTSNQNRILKPFFTNDFRIRYGVIIKQSVKIDFNVVLNNFTNRMYEPNGYTYSYVAGGALVTSNNYYPMAGINLMGGVVVTVGDFK
jgi:iron complex outermembrane receptor protein